MPPFSPTSLDSWRIHNVDNTAQGYTNDRLQINAHSHNVRGRTRLTLTASFAEDGIIEERFNIRRPGVRLTGEHGTLSDFKFGVD